MKILVLIERKKLEISDWGGGKGLIWEIKKELDDNHSIDVMYLEPHQGKIKRAFYQMGGYVFNKLDFDYDDYDRIIVFPGYLFWIVSKKQWKKTIIVSPDSLILNASSLYRVTQNWFRKNTIRRLFICISKLHEKALINKCYRYIVVGKNDRRYIRQVLKKRCCEDINKVRFLHHPILSNEQYDINVNELLDCSGEKRFIFSGDLAKTYQEVTINALVSSLKKREKDLTKELFIVVLGKNNEWVAKLFRGISHVKVKYVRFIEDYYDVCRFGRDVHCIPLASGSGTKNRTLTAIVNGLEIISTPIGMENIKYNGLTHIYIHRDMGDFAAEMIKVNNHVFEEEDFLDMLTKRKEFIMMMKSIKKEEINILFN
ncbi:hypothetical protein SAMN02910356_00722 [Selenomonas sp. GACV-9]|uniref:hypothetical protein n=1 Tax=Selenomonas sp. GACV-9 TaxID=3158782 RepID=UPI0008E39C3A|nr:hypothetical protein SAMN02910356_00722 [Selenomonas ruminantium]